MVQQSNAIAIFCCYAHEDQGLLDEFKMHLSPLQRQNVIHMWHDGDISAGTEWDQEIKRYLNEAKIILLFISSDFIASEYCYSIEMQHAQEQYKQGEARVIPVILRHVQGWEKVPFGDIQLGRLQALPKEAKPVTSRIDHDEVWKDVVKGIEGVVDELLLRGSVPSVKPQSSILRRAVLAGLGVIAAVGMTGSSAALLTRLQGTRTPSPPVTPGTVLYQADLSKPDRIFKEWEGDILSGGMGWKISNGTLFSSGRSTNETIWVKSVLPTDNYALEAHIQVLTLPDGRSYNAPAFGLLLRGQPGYLIEITGLFVLDTAMFSADGRTRAKPEAPYLVDLMPHVYRAEVKGTTLRFIIDTATIFKETDKKNLYPFSGQVGLMTSGVPVKVTSFKVIAL